MVSVVPSWADIPLRRIIFIFISCLEEFLEDTQQIYLYSPVTMRTVGQRLLRAFFIICLIVLCSQVDAIPRYAFPPYDDIDSMAESYPVREIYFPQVFHSLKRGGMYGGLLGKRNNEPHF
ncbi:hypothetical protein PHET_04444 [Paragonimus heterotremus]|uniref:Uncharacterized protein n=1 Tax=Paragonimus heterotremus TaxID=100268 RepID=A0A8J4WS81_9TREM|nr:hypothetical protein PHET_04444 [Paragonimus heterotremus]